MSYSSLSKSKGKGLLACEKWVNEFKLGIAKIQPETLNKKLVDPREKKYSHSDFVAATKEKFLLSSYETEEIYLKISEINKTYHKEKRRLSKKLMRLQNYPAHIRSKAEDLLLNKDPQSFIQATLRKKHVGDEKLVKNSPCMRS